MDILWQDIAISIGSAIGLVTKSYALLDERTVWDRKSSLTNSLFYIPSIAAFYSLGLWITLFTTSCSFILWLGIAAFRTPEKQPEKNLEDDYC